MSRELFMFCRVLIAVASLQLVASALRVDRESEPAYSWPNEFNGKANNGAKRVGSDLGEELVDFSAGRQKSGLNEAAKNIDGSLADDSLSPVILVPGYGGSRLEIKRNKTKARHSFCAKVSDWSNLWIEIKLMVPFMIDCLIEDFKLEFDFQTNTTRNTQGVDIRVRTPDNVASVEFLCDLHLSNLGYFAPIIKRLTNSFGYKRNYNIKGAPYDFRKAPNELDDFFAKLKRDSESLYEQFHGIRLTYICHSMGCNNILRFLQQQPKQWKDKHVLRVISLAAPWAGSLQAVRATVFGDNLGMPYLFDEAKLKIVQKSVPSTMYLFPNERVFEKTPLITFNSGAQSKNLTTSGQKEETLTARHFKRLFEKIDHPSGYSMWLNTKDLLGSLEAPQVEVWCLYGQGTRSLSRMDFRGDFPNSKRKDIFEDGDGTVTLQSSRFCEQWSGQQVMPVHAVPFHAGHVEMLRNNKVLNLIETIMADRIHLEIRV